MKCKKSRAMLFKLMVFFVLLVIFSAFVFKSIILKKMLYPQGYKNYVETYSKEYNIDKNLVYSVIKCESNFESSAVSHMNAKGLMQISDMTGIWASEELGIKNFDTDSLFVPEINILIGCWYLNKLINQYDNVETALAAYNAGSGNVSRWLADDEYSSDGLRLDYIPYKETRNYVKKVQQAKKIYEYLYR